MNWPGVTFFLDGHCLLERGHKWSRMLIGSHNEILLYGFPEQCFASLLTRKVFHKKSFRNGIVMFRELLHFRTRDFT